ncbi:MAG: sulfite exporter TauE/SafE family protein [Burkholderiales bacterium]
MTGWLGFLLSAAFFAGLLGGVHCAAMCGGIVVACTSRRANGAFDWRRALAYNTGRISSYAIAGAVAGALGQASVAFRGGATTHHVLLALAGTALVLMGLYIGGASWVVRGLEAAGAVAWRRIQPWSRAFLPASTPTRALGLGFVWGWLPCGMVYAVLMTAVASADALQGAAVMVAFGLGTLPNLLAVAVVADRLRSLSRRPVLRVAAAASVAVLGFSALLAAAGAQLFPGDGLFCVLPGAHALH